MHKRKLLAMVVTSAITLSAAAESIAADMTYVGIHGMWTDLKDADFNVAPGTIDTEFDSGTGFGITLGRTFEPMRAELEFTARMNDVKSHSLNGSPTLPGSKGEAKSNAFMVNGYYDFVNESSFTPYVGGGIGIANVKFDNFGVDPIPDVLNDDGTVFAYQVMAGADVKVSDAWKLFAEYRYFRTSEVDVVTSNVTGAVDNSIAYKTNNILVGARILF